MNSKNYKVHLKELLKTEFDKQLYLPADKSKAQQFINTTYIRDQSRNKLTTFCNNDSFKKYGVGVYLFFEFIKSLTIVFSIMSIIQIIIMGIYFSFSGLKDDVTSTGVFFAKFSMANLDKTFNFKFQQVILILELISSCIFLVFIIYWAQIQKSEIIKCAQLLALPSYYTLILKKIPDNYTDEKMIYFFSKFGKIQQIYTVKNYQNSLFYYKKLNSIVADIKLENSLIRIDKERTREKLILLKQQFKDLYQQIIDIEKQRIKVQPVFAFMTFSRIPLREHILNLFRKKLCGKDEDLKYQEQELQLTSCDIQPSAINWQNIHLNKYQQNIRWFWQIILLTFILISGIIILFGISLIGQSYTNSNNSTSNQNEYCAKLSIFDYYSNYNICKPYIKDFINELLIILFFPLVIVILKQILSLFIQGLSEYRRFKSIVQKIKSQIIIYLVFWFCSSALLILFLHIEINSTSVNDFLWPMINYISKKKIDQKSQLIYNDFTKEWYIQIGKQILITGFFSFGTGSMLEIILKAIKSAIFKYLSDRAKVQKQMNDYLKGQDLEFASVYAQILFTIFFIQFYSTGMPLLVLIGAISLFIIYVITKYIFVTFCREPPLFNNSINKLVIRLMMIGFVIHNIMSPLFFGGSLQFSLNNTYSIASRYLQYYHYALLTGLLLIYIFFRQIIVSSLIILYKKFINRSNELPTQIQNIHQTYKEAIKRSNKSFTYNIQQNQEFQLIINTILTINRTQINKTIYLNRSKHNSLHKSILNKFREPINNKVFPQIVQIPQVPEFIYDAPLPTVSRMIL